MTDKFYLYNLYNEDNIPPNERIMDRNGWTVAHEPEFIPDDWLAVGVGEYHLDQDINEVGAEERGLLRRSGIKYMVRFLQKKLGMKYPRTYYAMQIFVPPERAEEAYELLNQEDVSPEYEAEFLDGEGGLPQITCPECGDTHDMDWPKCPECGYKYN